MRQGQGPYLQQQSERKAASLVAAGGGGNCSRTVTNVRLVYLEWPNPAIFSRNGQRDSTLSNKDLERMLHRLKVPLPWEAHAVEYDVRP